MLGQYLVQHHQAVMAIHRWTVQVVRTDLGELHADNSQYSADVAE